MPQTIPIVVEGKTYARTTAVEPSSCFGCAGDNSGLCLKLPPCVDGDDIFVEVAKHAS